MVRGVYHGHVSLDDNVVNRPLEVRKRLAHAAVGRLDILWARSLNSTNDFVV